MHYSLATCISASAASGRPEFVKQSLIQYHLCNDRRRMVGAPMFARSIPQKYISIVNDLGAIPHQLEAFYIISDYMKV